MGNLSKILLIIVILVSMLSIAFCFYWYEIKPSRLAQKCTETALDAAVESSSGPHGTYNRLEYDHYYKLCLRANGQD